MVPETLSINGHLYDIISVAPDDLLAQAIAEGEVVAGKGSAWGHTSFTKCQITIRNDLTPSMFLQVLIHEVLHGLLEPHNIREEEQLVRLLEVPLTRFLKDNPVLLEHIMSSP